ncbi:unnamed protein product [Blepharisma stoltei]|uniref:SAM domain-containing protein n=1 Tax=Blepharisma stoltei TaxID=1481888 RepID=A0AAU9K1S7_9CILI|nr:unnamed protein product [Blepharisma stoltei]
MHYSIDEFCQLCRRNEYDLINSILEVQKSIKNQRDSKLKLPPIWHALLYGLTDIVKLLLEKGADPNIPNEIGETPLHHAADNNEYEIAKLLLENNANPNLFTNENETALHQATFRGQVKIVELLMSKGANPNIVNNYGKTSLHTAAEYDQIECVRILLSYGADQFIVDHEGRLPIDLSKSSTVRNIIEGFISKISFEGDLALFSIPEGRISDEDRTSTIYSFQGTPRLSHYTHLSIDDFNESPLSNKSNYNTKEMPTSDYNRIRSKETASSLYEVSENLEEHEENLSIFSNTFKQFLEKIKLEEYYQVLIKAGFDDFESLVKQMKTPLPLTYEILASSGITKPGHIFRFLMMLDVEAGITDKTLFDPKLLLPSYSSSFSLHCGDMPKNNEKLKEWLISIKLENLVSIFEESGFDDIEMMILQMFSRYPVNDDMIKNQIGIEKTGHRIRILGKLHEDAKGIIDNLNKCGENQHQVCSGCELL